MNSLIRYIMGHKKLVLGSVFVVTALAIWALADIKMGQSMGRSFFGDDPRYEAYLERIRSFGSDEALLVAFEADDLLSPEGLKRLRGVVESLEEHEEVENVASILDAQRIAKRGDTLRIERYLTAAEKNPEQRSAILDELRSDDAVQGVLLSADGRHTTVVIELTINEERPVEGAAELEAEFMKVFHDAGYAPEDLHKGGLPVIMAASIAISMDSLTILFPLAGLILFFMALILLRRLLPAMISAGVSLIAVTWTMGLVIFLDPHLGAIVSIVPVIVIIVGFADVIHLWNAYLVELTRGLSKEDAIVSACSEVGKACFFTSATTFVGFFSLILIPSPAFEMMAIALSFGVAMALLLAVAIMPILLQWRPAPELSTDKLGGRAHQFIEDSLIKLGRFSTRRAWLVIVAFIGLLVPSFYGMSRFTVDDDLVGRFPDDHPIQVDSKYFDEHFSGTEAFDIFIDASEKDGLLDPELFKKLDELEQTLEADPQIREVTSVVDVIRRMHGLLADDGTRLPTTRQGLAQTLLLFEMSGGKELSRLIDFDRKSMRISVRYGYLAMREGYVLGDRVQQITQSIIGDTVKAEVNGFSFLLGDWYEKLIGGQKKSLLVSALIIAIMMAIGLGSVSAGLWSMLPNLLPLFVLAGFMGIAREVIDGDSFIALIIALGIAMDDTIHFLSRYRLEARTAKSVEDALANTFRFAGRAIVITTIILALGFLPMVGSDYSVIAYWGTDVGFALIVALLADVMLIPAMIKVGWIRFPMPNLKAS